MMILINDRRILMVLLMLFLCTMASAQEDLEAAAEEAQEFMEEAEEQLAKNDMAKAEALYRKAIAKNPDNATARYNLGNLYYTKDIISQAGERHGQAASTATEKDIKHAAFHNRGNSFMRQKKYKEAVEAYKNALRNDPEDDQTRYNLALAMKLLEEEKKKGGGGGQNDQEKDQQKQDQQKQDQQGDQEKNQEGNPQDQQKGKDKQDKGQDQQKNQEKPGKEGQEKQPENKEGEQTPQQPQPKPGQLSPQQVKNLLEAMGNQEKKVQERINAEKVKGSPARTEKDW